MPSSEREVFEALRCALGQDFVVFHSVSWRGRGKKPDGEADFLIAHPDLGLLVLEMAGDADDETFEALLYVGTSGATTHLALVASQPIIERLKHAAVGPLVS